VVPELIEGHNRIHAHHPPSHDRRRDGDRRVPDLGVNDAYRDLVSAEYLNQMTVATRTERWGSRIRSGERTILLAERDGTLEGVVSFGLTDEVLELMSLYVAPNIRGSGLGTRLLRVAVGDRPATLWVFRDNLRAIEFYRRHDFELDGSLSQDDDTTLMLARMTRGSGGT
jgi:GNAT superfamily N-acetyltransferase